MLHLHASYWVDLRPLEAGDADRLHSLAISVNWSHRARDMSQFLQLGSGFIASDEIDRPVGAGMYFPMGDDVAMIGLMMTRHRLQHGGVGHEILDRILRACGDRSVSLNATPEALSLYRSAGFQERGTVVQYQGIAVDETPQISLPKGHALHEVSATDLPGILELDRSAFGTDRRALIELFMRWSDGVLLQCGGETVGYALCRDFGRGRVIGPLVAPSEPLAMALAAAVVRQNSGSFLRLDSDQAHKRLGAFLTDCGLLPVCNSTSMTRGHISALQPHRGVVHALASQATG